MNDSLPDTEPPRMSWADKVQAIFEVLLLSGVISSLLAGLLFHALPGKNTANPLISARNFSFFILTESAIALALLAVILKFHKETLLDLGLHWNRWKRHLIRGLMLVPCLFFINALVSIVFKLYLPQYYIEKNPLTDLIRTPQQLILIIFSALIAGGIKEELQRAFIITRFRLHLGSAGLGLVLWSVAFGLGHYIQGVQGVFVATIYGFVFGLIYILSGSLIAPIVAHSAYDTVALLAYWLSIGRYN
jgi:membrane protease YdiL (CAAX protease family)